MVLRVMNDLSINVFEDDFNYLVSIHFLIESYNCPFNCMYREIYTKFLGFFFI